MSGRFWFGLFFVVLGFGFLLQQADVWNFANVLSSWWPLILIIIGVIQLTNRNISSISGYVFIVVGGLFLANQWVQVNLLNFIWPILLILVGLAFIFSRVNRARPTHSDRTIHSFSLFSGADVRCQSQNFEGGSVTAIFGGAEIDLRDAKIADEGAALDLSAMFGGISISVPENVRLEVTGIPIFGGWENKTRKHVNDNENLPILKVNCLTAFGGVEIND